MKISEIRKERTAEEVEREARFKGRHLVKLLVQKDGKIYANYVDSGNIIRFKSGTEYRVAEDGSLRRVKK